MKMECTVTGARLVARDVAAMTVRAPELAAACEPGQFAHIYCGGGVYSLSLIHISTDPCRLETMICLLMPHFLQR